MKQLSPMCCVVLLITSLILSGVISERTNDDRGIDATGRDFYTKRKPSAMWFGPRLGRKKRNQSMDDVFHMPSQKREEIDSFMDAFQDSPWGLSSFSDGKKDVYYTPRLGRESGEVNNMLGEDRWLQDSEYPGDMMAQRSPPFAPRLGRGVLHFNPRLGRKIDKTLYVN